MTFWKYQNNTDASKSGWLWWHIPLPRFMFIPRNCCSRYRLSPTYPFNTRGFFSCATKFINWIILLVEVGSGNASGLCVWWDQGHLFHQPPSWGQYRSFVHALIADVPPFIAYWSFVKSDKSWNSIHVSVRYTFVIVEISLWSLGFFRVAPRVTGHLRDGVIMEIHSGQKIRKRRTTATTNSDTSQAV